MVVAVRKAIESMYTGKCTVWKYQAVKNPVTKISSQDEVAVVTDQPCRLSFKNITTVSAADGAATVTQIVKLLLAPEVIIKPGSKITVTQNGITTDYQSSGKPAVYTHHQEIILELFKGWA
jgi:hypothetical protein